MRTLRAGILPAIMAMTAIVPVGKVYAQDWPDIFNPLELVALNLEMDPGDWNTIQNDEKFDIEVPAMFWMDGEKPILVAVRRKPGDPLGGGPFIKVSLKIDINELVPGQLWHDLRKLSLENGDDENVVSEAVAWYLHRLASGPEGYGYDPGLASWITLKINGVYTGVYVNAEQRDKRFLQNRGIFVSGETWLYKVSSPNQVDLKVGGPKDSPTFMALCYEPFAPDPSCSTPDPATLAAELPLLVNLQGLLTLGAIDSFTGNSDAIFSHGKNFYFADFLSGLTRQYYPWDLDSTLGGGAIDYDIYQTGSAYGSIMLGVPEFRAQYSQILNDLICGPLSASSLVAFVDAIEPVLTEALANDPNNQIDGSIADHFDSLRNWLSDRVANVTAQIENFEPCDVLPCPWDIDGNNDVGVKDLLFLLGAWGPCPKKGDCPADFDNNGDVDVPDLLDLLGNWGPCP
ncbi:MAG: CotH kinase family protein [Planctomycetes bacterium]|nr:CotH kinase family protein [Planctomycetota bacterium]